MAVQSDVQMVAGMVASSAAETAEMMVDRSEQTSVDQWVAS